MKFLVVLISLGSGLVEFFALQRARHYARRSRT
jgi:hypothetical protein